jgi:site-specific DNA-methyltransferase (adenine-specific)
MWQEDILNSPARVKNEHEWQQNIEPIKTLIEKFSVKGQLVVDPFLGSGTTMKACKELDRQFFGMDTDEDVFRNGQA